MNDSLRAVKRRVGSVPDADGGVSSVLTEFLLSRIREIAKFPCTLDRARNLALMPCAYTGFLSGKNLRLCARKAAEMFRILNRRMHLFHAEHAAANDGSGGRCHGNGKLEGDIFNANLFFRSRSRCFWLRGRARRSVRSRRNFCGCGWRRLCLLLPGSRRRTKEND